jgi:hypothetical protein
MSGVAKWSNGSANLELARRIRAAGVPIFIEEDDEPAAQRLSNGLLIKQIGGLADSHAFDFCGAAGIVCWLRITTLRSALAISSFDLQLPWTTRVQWLDQCSDDGIHWRYQFSGRNSLGFDAHEVLNRFADSRQVHDRGFTMEGCLMGISLQPIPESFEPGLTIPAKVVITDQFQNKCASPVKLWLDRSQQKSAANYDPKPGRSSSYADAEIVEDLAHSEGGGE